MKLYEPPVSAGPCATLSGGMISELWRSIRSDIEEGAGRHLGPVMTLAVVLGSRGVQVAVAYRVGHALSRRGLSLISAALQRLAQLLWGADIDFRARIGPGLVLRHPVGIVVGRDAVLGQRVRLFQNVTIGNRMSGSHARPDGMPVLEDDVHVYAGAAVLGPVTIGARTTIGANAVVTRSCPPDSVVKAPPAIVTSP